MKPGLEFRIEDLSPLGKSVLAIEGSPTERMVSNTEATEKELEAFYERYLRDSETAEDDLDDIASRYGKTTAGMALYAAAMKHGDAYGLWIDALFSVLSDDAE